MKIENETEIVLEPNDLFAPLYAICRGRNKIHENAKEPSKIKITLPITIYGLDVEYSIPNEKN